MSRNYERCGNCHFQRGSWCHRFPPMVPKYERSGDYIYPKAAVHVQVEDSSWCGEYRRAVADDYKRHEKRPKRPPAED